MKPQGSLYIISQKQKIAVPQTHLEETPEMINIREEIQQLNQQIEEMGCNRWQFQELHRLGQQLK